MAKRKQIAQGLRSPSAGSAVHPAPEPSSKISLGGLDDRATFDGFTTHDLISGLHGVCVVLDSAIVDGSEFEDHLGTMCGLVMAAKVLSSILRTEAHS